MSWQRFLTKRFVNEIHDHKEELRSSNELLTAFQKSERKGLHGEERGTSSTKETCASPSQHSASKSIPNVQIKYGHQKQNMQTFLTKGSFSRDEWNHLLRLFNTMSFSMFSCGHKSDFLSDDQDREQSAMSKRGQDATSNEGSPMAKTRPCLVARDSRSEEISSRSLRSLVNPGIPMKEKKQK